MKINAGVTTAASEKNVLTDVELRDKNGEGRELTAGEARWMKARESPACWSGTGRGLCRRRVVKGSARAFSNTAQTP